MAEPASAQTGTGAREVRARRGGGSHHGVLALLGLLYRLLRPELRQYRGAVARSLAVTLFSTALDLLGPLLIFLVVDAGLRGNQSERLPWLIAATLLTYAVAVPVSKIAATQNVRTAEALLFELKTRLVDAVMAKPVSFHNTLRHGELTSVLSEDVEKLSQALREHGAGLPSSTLFIGLLLIVLLALDWRLALPVLILALAMVYALARDHAGRVASVLRHPDAAAMQQARLLDILNGARTIRLFQLQPRLRRAFRDAALRLRRRNEDAEQSSALGWGARASFLGHLINVAPLLVGILMLHNQVAGLTVGLLVAFRLYTGLLITNLRTVALALGAQARLGDTLTHLLAVFDYPTAPAPAATDLNRVPDDYRLEVRDLRHRRGVRWIFDGFGFTAAPGEKLAIVGPSGAGKSTLADLILRMEEPEGGEIRLGGIPAREIDLPVYLSYFAHVGEETFLFNATVRENIAMGWQGVPDADIEQAARLVRLHEVIQALPEGYDTRVQSNGHPLSIGQAQRLALARAIIREPAVLVLDQFTAALDPETEADIMDDMLRTFPDATILCLTHSPAVRARMDRVIRLVPDGGAAAAGERVAPADRDRLPDPAAPATLALAADETAAVPRVAAWIDDRCAALGLSADLAFQVHLALEELVTNVVEHATRGERSGRIVIDIRDSGAELTVIVADTGPPFDPTRVPPPDTTLSLEDREVGGLGLHLVRSMMDRIAYRREKGHNVVVLGKAIGPAAPSAGEPRGLDGGGDGGDASRP